MLANMLSITPPNSPIWQYLLSPSDVFENLTWIGYVPAFTLADPITTSIKHEEMTELATYNPLPQAIKHEEMTEPTTYNLVKFTQAAKHEEMTEPATYNLVKFTQAAKHEEITEPRTYGPVKRPRATTRVTPFAAPNKINRLAHTKASLRQERELERAREQERVREQEREREREQERERERKYKREQEREREREREPNKKRGRPSKMSKIKIPKNKIDAISKELENGVEMNISFETYEDTENNVTHSVRIIELYDPDVASRSYLVHGTDVARVVGLTSNAARNIAHVVPKNMRPNIPVPSHRRPNRGQVGTALSREGLECFIKGSTRFRESPRYVKWLYDVIIPKLSA
jgi:hypothetical protein